MPKKSIDFLKSHVRDHLIIYLLVFFCFLIGISVGAFTVKAIEVHQKQDLVAYLKSFFQVFHGDQIQGREIFKQSLANNLQLIFFSWLLGLLIVGIPFVFMIMGFKGFVMGFTVGLLIEEFHLQGILIFLLAVLPQNLLIIPCFIFSTVLSLGFSFNFIKGKLKGNRNYQYFQQLLRYTSLHLPVFGFIIIAAIIEAYLSPLFIRLLVK